MRFDISECVKTRCVGALFRTPLGELTALPVLGKGERTEGKRRGWETREGKVGPIPNKNPGYGPGSDDRMQPAPYTHYSGLCAVVAVT